MEATLKMSGGCEFLWDRRSGASHVHSRPGWVCLLGEVLDVCDIRSCKTVSGWGAGGGGGKPANRNLQVGKPAGKRAAPSANLLCSSALLLCEEAKYTHSIPSRTQHRIIRWLPTPFYSHGTVRIHFTPRSPTAYNTPKRTIPSLPNFMPTG